MQQRLAAELFVVGCMLVVGCGAPASRPAPSAPDLPNAMPFEGPADLCPMTVEGTVVEAENIEGGIGLTFTTVGDVAELRRRVRLIARLNGERAGTPTLITTTDDMRDGARLNIRPVDPSRVISIRDSGRARAEVLDNATCPANLGSEALVSWIVEPGRAPDRVVTAR